MSETKSVVISEAQVVKKSSQKMGLGNGLIFRLEKAAAIRLLAVRETGVFRHHMDAILGPPETPRTSQHYHIEGLKGALNWAPIMPLDACLSDSRCKYLLWRSYHTGLYSHDKLLLRIEYSIIFMHHVQSHNYFYLLIILVHSLKEQEKWQNSQ